MTGMCRTRFCVISPISSAVVAFGSQVTTTAVMISRTGCSRARDPCDVGSPGHIPLGDDSGDVAAVLADHRRTDLVLGE